MIDKKKNLKIALAIFCTALLLRLFVFEGFVVRGDSMAPSIISGDYVLVEKLSYKFRDPQKGDVVVALTREDDQRVLKRVVGVHGEILEVQGKPWNVDPGEYYLVGDNVDVSTDSRDFGTVDTWDVKGKVFGAISWSRLDYLSF
jgi:signal peptidase I